MNAFLGRVRLLGQSLGHLLYPNFCWVCRAYMPARTSPLCSECENSLGNDSFPTCPRCSSSVGPNLGPIENCPACQKETFAFDGVFRWGPYEGKLREVLLRMKEPQGEGLAEIVAEPWSRALAARLEPLQPTVVLPVPLHWGRRWQRGYNSSEILARALAVRLKVPLQTRWLKRRRRTAAQRELSPTARRDNVKDAFCLRRWLPSHPGTIILVDDVLTTGATAHEAARQLKLLKPERIYVAVAAHGR